ncbi:MAG: hypothetical protein U9Q70_12275 [Chloroflexota bacterium]|nr:hypothetical protein [Chloroflexota bacterium]
MNDAELLYFNGINGASGEYDLPPLRAQDIASVALGEELPAGVQRELENRHLGQADHFGINADQTNLAETGWGIIFAATDPRTAAIRAALQPLLELRREQATQQDGRYYQEYYGPTGYRPGDSYLDFLGREPRLMGPGPADPEKVPYYLLIIGAPETIPYRFQYHLDVQYAVGRLHFETLEEYAQYAASVVAAETGAQLRLPRRAAFFGVRNPDDQATSLSYREMIQPLVQEFSSAAPDWEIDLVQDAKKARLAQLLGGADTPALLFSASHGMAFPNGDPRQLRHQGALLCNDWPGPRNWRHKPIPEEFYFSTDDVSANAQLAGMIAFFFACYGAGTPQLDQFAHKTGRQAAIAPCSFLAQLPQRLLGHPQGSALAVVGHVERAWGYSFVWGRSGRQLKVFEDTLEQLLAGYPLGAAMEWFNERHAELSVALAGELEKIEYGGRRDDLQLAGMWTANNDARSYVILGDPAVRLPVAAVGETPPERPTIKAAAIPPAQEGSLGKSQAAPSSNSSAPSAVTPLAAGGDRTDVDYVTSFGLTEQFSGLTSSLRTFTSQIATALNKAAEELMTLEVKTYSTTNLAAVSAGAEELAQLRALTRVAFDGDMQVYVPERSGGLDPELWHIHQEMVKEAQINRAQFLQAMAEMATSLLKTLKP